MSSGVSTVQSLRANCILAASQIRLATLTASKAVEQLQVEASASPFSANGVIKMWIGMVGIGGSGIGGSNSIAHFPGSARAVGSSAAVGSETLCRTVGSDYRNSHAITE